MAQAIRIHQFGGPEAVSDVDASAGFLRGMTAQYLLRQARSVQAGDAVLVHAAAGGMGQLLSQWAKHLGATVIGTVGTSDKARIAQDIGCDHAINYTTEDFAARVTEITGGKGVNVVYDSVGRDVYAGNIAVLAPLGSYVNYGHASGLLPPIDAMELNRKSLIFTKTSLKDYAAPEGAIARMSGEAFELIGKGVLKLAPQTYPLTDAAQAQADMAGRKTTGQVVLLP